MDARQHIWIVEIRWQGEWGPTVGSPTGSHERLSSLAAITREDGRRKLATWKARNPGDRFRLVRYERKESVDGR